MKSWILFLLGTLAYFLIRYVNRTDKVKDFNLKFWIKDNWPELSVAVILDIAVMIILMDENTNITAWLSTYLPAGIVVSAKLALSLACGLGLGAGVYELFKKKLKDKNP